MKNIKNDYGLDMSKLVNQLRVKAGVMEMGERIEWGSDIALMREAADKIEALEEVVKAVAHVGIDLGYGKYEIQPEVIDKARAIYERGDV